MIRKINLFSICFAFGLSVLLILAGSRYTDDNYYHRPLYDNRRHLKFLKYEYVDDNYMEPIPTNAYDGMPDVDKILNRTKTKIKFETKHYNFTSSNVKSLEDLLMESGGNPIRNLIISTWRSGTTFLGEIFNAMPGTFYHYEPLLKYEIVQIRGPPDDEKVLEMMTNMFRCNFYNMDGYFEYGITHLHQFSHNTRLWDQCKFRKDLCFNPDFTSKYCKLFPFQSMKVVRVRLHLVEKLLLDTQLNLKIVLLVRDPRGVMQSRQHRNFCQPSPDCSNAEILCADMISDYVAAARLIKDFPNRIMVLRYEELAINPTVTTRKMFKFLKLDYTPSVEEFIQAHTTMEVAGVSSTFRVSHQVPFKWTSILDFDFVEDIQLACKDAMELWGYKMAHNHTHMTSTDFNPLDLYTIKL